MPASRPEGLAHLAAAVRHQQRQLDDLSRAIEAGVVTPAEAEHVLQLLSRHLAVLRRTAARSATPQPVSAPRAA